MNNAAKLAIGLGVAWVVFGQKGGGAVAAAGESTGSSTGQDESTEEKTANIAKSSPVWPQGTGTDWSSSGPQMSSGTQGYSDFGLPDFTPATKRDPYLDQLYGQEAVYKGPIRDFYSVPRLRAIAWAAATYYGLPASWVWGILQGESNFFPVGIFRGYKGTADYAKKYKTTAYGMGQMLNGRYKYEAPHWLATSEGMAKAHRAFLDPKWGIWSVAASYGRMAKNRGGGWNKPLGDQAKAVDRMARGYKSPSWQGPLAVGHWWAGTKATKGAQAKVRQILKYGMQIHEDGKLKPSSAWSKMTPGAKAVDYLPPWKTGSISPQGITTMHTAQTVLESAGNPLFSLNAGLV